ncbi:MAG: [Fe-Fe] hydrogenase large subunit C-terminal domain-containing protein [Mediterraneibacter gnavus]
MPCTRKESRDQTSGAFYRRKAGCRLCTTTTEVTRMIQEAGIDLSRIEPEALDMPFGLSSGAGAILRDRG